MGVYIKGVDMPRSNPTWVVIHRGGIIEVNDGSGWKTIKDGAIEVKAPHGRLIDRDAFLDDMNCGLWDWSTVDGITATTALKQTMSDLRNTPTVLGAEGKDDG
jgi:hypothetical protein